MGDENDDSDEGATGGGKGERTVPYDRFQKVVAERNELKRKLAEAEKTAQDATEKAATADTLATHLEREKKDRAREKAEWDADRGLISAGLVDEDVRDLARHLYGRLPEKDRPTMSDWLKGLVADPTKAPKLLAPHLPKPAEGDGKGAADSKGSSSSAAGGGTKGGNASTRTGVKTDGQQGAGDPVSAEKLREVRERAQKTGDWSEWKRIRGHKSADDKASADA